MPLPKFSDEYLIYRKQEAERHFWCKDWGLTSPEARPPSDRSL